MARVELSAPGCAQGCETCFRDCAVANVKLGWWQGELQRLLALKLTPRRAGYGEWRERVEEAQAKVSRLTVDRAGLSIMSRPRRQAPRLRLVHSAD